MEVFQGVRSPDGFSRDGLSFDLVLCASELVNLSLLANSTAMTVWLLVEPGVFRLSLIDDCPILTDREDPAFHAQAMGLLMIKATADSFGIDASGLGRELWTRFEPGEPESPGAGS